MKTKDINRLSMNQTARLLGVSQAHVSMVLNGKRQSRRLEEKLNQLFGFSIPQPLPTKTKEGKLK